MFAKIAREFYQSVKFFVNFSCETRACSQSQLLNFLFFFKVQHKLCSTFAIEKGKDWIFHIQNMIISEFFHISLNFTKSQTISTRMKIAKEKRWYHSKCKGIFPTNVHSHSQSINDPTARHGSPLRFNSHVFQRL